MKIDIHADDYALSGYASEILLQLLKEQKLDSISIMPNMSCYEVCMKRLHEEWENFPKKPLISVHLNLMEGHCVSDAEKVPQLVDQRGFFKCSWGSLFLGSYGFGARGELQREIQVELAAQIHRVRKDLPKGCELRLDSHQHTHMIPVVRLAMFTAIDELPQHTVAFVRDSREPLAPFLKKISLVPSYGLVNLVKNILLNIYATPLERGLRERGIRTSLLWGLNMSGHMDIERIKVIYPQMVQYFTGKQEKIQKEIGIENRIELLFHPGIVLPIEINEEYVKPDFVEFHMAEGRKVERHAVECLTQEVLHDH
ncbi:MAG: ChbG/HpnK family deacetylase [Lachnospiraceae bacterium]|nr:ChbG/HpnK family deacetylase [Lachnospiraceae bacterium]